MVSDLKILAGSAAAIAALLCPEYESIQSSSRRLLSGGNPNGTGGVDVLPTSMGGILPDNGAPESRPDYLSQGGATGGFRFGDVGDGISGDGYGNANYEIYSASRILRKRQDRIRDLVTGTKDHECFRNMRVQESQRGALQKDATENEVSTPAVVVKTIGYGALLTGLTFAVFSMHGYAPLGLGPTEMILIIGICITVGLVTQFMGKKVFTKSALTSLILVGGAGFAFTYSTLLAQTAETDVALLHLSNILMTGAAFGALAFALFYIFKSMGGWKFYKVMFREGLRWESTGLTGVALALTGLAICTIPNAINAEAVSPAWTPIVTLASLCTLWVGLAIFALSFLQEGKLGMEGRANYWLRTGTYITLLAGGAAVAGVGIQLYGGEAVHAVGTQLLQYGGIAFVALFATMCIYFSYKFCKAGKNVAI